MSTLVILFSSAVMVVAPAAAGRDTILLVAAECVNATRETNSPPSAEMKSLRREAAAAFTRIGVATLLQRAFPTDLATPCKYDKRMWVAFK
jgi:hypothetical protein